MNETLFHNKRILVTGGTGSFGHFIVKRLAGLMPAEIRVFSRDEKKQDDMRHEFAKRSDITFVLGDVRNERAVRHVVRDIDIIFQAAALKQVPSCEYNVFEAVQTNILGAANIVNAAIEEGVEKVVAISTDKAVKPVNVMGMTKSIQERLFISANLLRGSKKTVFACVRYGNVIGSRGSVIPLFAKQIERGGPVTLTDAGMTRFILPLSHAVTLVFEAVEQCVGGEVFIPKIPAINIKELAKMMIEESSEGKKVEIKEIGVRPGEKIHEVLLSEEERPRTIDNGDSYIILPSIDIPGVAPHYAARERLSDMFEYSSGTTRQYTRRALKELLERERFLGK